MKANMNAINGAIQQTDRLLNKLRNESDEKSKAQKKKRRMKTLKQHIKDKEYDDFEEDLMKKNT